jgi:hypothetical protein
MNQPCWAQLTYVGRSHPSELVDGCQLMMFVPWILGFLPYPNHITWGFSSSRNWQSLLFQQPALNNDTWFLHTAFPLEFFGKKGQNPVRNCT